MDNTSKLFIAASLFGLASLHAGSALAADHDYYVHMANGDFISAGDITIVDQYDVPLQPVAGACGMRFSGSESHQWVNEYGSHLGTQNVVGAIDVRLRDRPGCSGSGIDISANGGAVGLPAYSIESFFVYQAGSARWLDNNGTVIPLPSCTQCDPASDFTHLQRRPEWNTLVLNLKLATSAGGRLGGNLRGFNQVVESLEAIDLEGGLSALIGSSARTINARRAQAGSHDDASIRDREDTALAALSRAKPALNRCTVALARRDGDDAAVSCQRAARLLSRAQTAVDSIVGSQQ